MNWALTKRMVAWATRSVAQRIEAKALARIVHHPGRLRYRLLCELGDVPAAESIVPLLDRCPEVRVVLRECSVAVLEAAQEVTMSIFPATCDVMMVSGSTETVLFTVAAPSPQVKIFKAGPTATRLVSWLAAETGRGPLTFVLVTDLVQRRTRVRSISGEGSALVLT